MENINQDEVVRLTEEYGKQWGINHTRRLLSIIEIIGEGLEYNQDAVWLAAHLHDWGGYGPWKCEGINHAIRSKQVAKAFLDERNYSDEFKELVLECIEHHHSGDRNRTMEAILLSDADGLDFLGVVGVLRDISKNPRELRKGYESAKKRREKVPAMLCLEKSRELAVERIKQMDELFSRFEKDSFGYF
jgi:uncharacterized protein